jgi:hypothetical protein
MQTASRFATEEKVPSDNSFCLRIVFIHVGIQKEGATELRSIMSGSKLDFTPGMLRVKGR